MRQLDAATASHLGRADNMVKLRGVNVFPEAVGAVVVEDARSNGEYFCVVDRVGEAGTDEMTVMVEARDTSVDAPSLKTDLERRMKEVLFHQAKYRSATRTRITSTSTSPTPPNPSSSLQRSDQGSLPQGR